MARRATAKKRSPKKEHIPRGPSKLKTLRLPAELFTQLRAVIGGGPGDRAGEVLGALEVGQTAVTSMSAFSFNKARSELRKEGREFDLVSGLFIPTRGQGNPTVRCVQITRIG